MRGRCSRRCRTRFGFEFDVRKNRSRDAVAVAIDVVHESELRSEVHASADDHFLPESSAWPFGVGVGAWLTVNGMVVGFGYAIPGLVVLALSISGLIAQSRRRA